MHRRVVTHFAVFAIGLAAGIGGVALAGGGDVRTASTNDAVVKQLKTVNRKLDVLNRTVGGSKTKAPKTSAWKLLQDICEASGSYSGCGKPLP